jgi:hypothetical protein
VTLGFAGQFGAIRLSFGVGSGVGHPGRTASAVSSAFFDTGVVSARPKDGNPISPVSDA